MKCENMNVAHIKHPMDTEKKFTLHLTTDEEKWPKCCSPCDMSNAWNLKNAINEKKNRRGKIELKTFFMVISWIWLNGK